MQGRSRINESKDRRHVRNSVWSSAFDRNGRCCSATSTDPGSTTTAWSFSCSARAECAKYPECAKYSECAGYSECAKYPECAEYSECAKSSTAPTHARSFGERH